ncbi:MAG TPA: hypothetical protein VJO15_04010 [Dehalococcoidia bacterium]|nr:hypothetical protein [Dehalococcoidia bacterium]
MKRWAATPCIALAAISGLLLIGQPLLAQPPGTTAVSPGGIFSGGGRMGSPSIEAWTVLGQVAAGAVASVSFGVRGGFGGIMPTTLRIFAPLTMENHAT